MEVLLDVGEYLIHVAISGELVGPLVSQIVWGLLLDVDATGQKDPVRITPGAPFEGRCRCLADS